MTKVAMGVATSLVPLLLPAPLAAAGTAFSAVRSLSGAGGGEGGVFVGALERALHSMAGGRGQGGREVAKRSREDWEVV